MGTVAVVALLLGAAVSLAGSLPLPFIHDEFSYLLASDTFAHGRLTNPTHPMWMHFESFHIIQQPTYASKYPAGQGLTLALGQAAFGLPIVGVWLTIAAASAATCWMLYGWVSPRWALVGGLLMAMHPQVMRWDHSYWGGGVAMLGGALLLGGARRLAVPEPRPRDAVPLAAGLAILANSRPFEGLVLAGVVLGLLLLWHLRQARHAALVIRRARAVMVPIIVILGATAAMMGYYNFRVTGNPLLLPYSVHEATYARMPIFFWQQPRTVPYRHAVMRDFWLYGWTQPDPEEANAHATTSRLRLLLEQRRDSMKKLVASMALNRGLLLPLLVLPWLLRRDAWLGPASLALGVSVIGILAGAWIQEHYAAPMVPLAMAIVVRTMSSLSTNAAGRALLVVSLSLSVIACVQEFRLLVRQDARNVTSWSAQRSRMRASLVQEGGSHLVVVRYRPGHPVLQEWVYNEADIDGAPVVWAREMDAAENQALLDYFSGRHIWLLEADAPVPTLTPYPPAR